MSCCGNREIIREEFINDDCGCKRGGFEGRRFDRFDIDIIGDIDFEDCGCRRRRRGCGICNIFRGCGRRRCGCGCGDFF